MEIFSVHWGGVWGQRIGGIIWFLILYFSCLEWERDCGSGCGAIAGGRTSPSILWSHYRVFFGCLTASFNDKFRFWIYGRQIILLLIPSS